ncbi:MAG: trigger factor [Dehalobacter sp.]|nr:trigger factor [Dehalobacter sp.]
MMQFELGQYKGLNLNGFDTSAKEDEINEAVNYLINSLEETQIEKNSEEIKAGDYVIVNIEGVEKNTTIPAVREYDYQFKVGDEGLIPELTTNLLGKKTGDTIVFEKTLQAGPLEYQHLWGRELEYKIEISRVFVIKKPELTDNMIQEIDPMLKTIDDLTQKLKEEISREKKTKEREANINIVLQALIKNSKYEFEEESLNQAAEDLYKKFAEELKNSNNMQLMEYLIHRKITADELLEECKEEAAKRMIKEQILDAVIEMEKIRATEEEIAYLKERIKKDQERGISSELFTDIHVVELQFLRKKAMSFLLKVNLVG